MLYLALHGIDWSAFFTSLRHVNYFYVALLFPWSSTSYFFRALRWRGLLLDEKRIPIANVFWANMVGYFGNNVLPARVGELMRAAYIARQNGLSFSFILATGVTERFMDLAALVIIGTGSLFFVDAFPRAVQDALKSFAVVTVTGVVFLFLFPTFHGLFSRFLASLEFLGESLKTRIQEIMTRFLEGVMVISRVERGLPFILFTALVWLMDSVGMMLFVLAFNETLTLLQAFLFISALGLSSAIPSTPGYVGVYQFVAVTMLVPFGISRESALAIILISQIINLLVVSCWGGIGFWLGSQTILTKGEG